VSLLAAAALGLPAAAEACDLSAVGAKSATDGSDELKQGDAVTFTLAGLEEGATYTLRVRDTKTGEHWTVAEDAPAPDPRSDKTVTYPVGDLGPDPRDLRIEITANHGTEELSDDLDVKYAGKRTPASSPPTNEPPAAPETPAAPPAGAAPTQQPPGPTDPAEHTPLGTAIASPPSANPGGPTGTTRGPRPDGGGPSEHVAVPQHTEEATPAAMPATAKRSLAAPDDRVRGAVVEARNAEPSAPRPVHHTVAPRPDRADSPSRPPTRPGAVAVASERPVESNLPAVIVAGLLAAGVAALVRSRRHPEPAPAIVPAPLPPRLPPAVAQAPLQAGPHTPSMRDLAIEAELQQLLAEHAARAEERRRARDEVKA